MKINEVMTRDVISLSGTSDLKHAAELMKEYNVGSLPVVEEGKVIGIVTDRDIAIRAFGEKRCSVHIMKKLRAPGGCPWDREQNYLSLRRYIIEEAYELIEAIENNDLANMCEECGDLMLQSVFISCMAEERDDFDICGVLDSLTEKLIRRHPHVFGDIKVSDSDDVLKNWERIKTAEREKKNRLVSSCGILRGLPALLRAYRMQEKAAKVGFDWPKGDMSPLFCKSRRRT